jgi:hypothetical protein
MLQTLSRRHYKIGCTQSDTTNHFFPVKFYLLILRSRCAQYEAIKIQRDRLTRLVNRPWLVHEKLDLTFFQNYPSIFNQPLKLLGNPL